GLRPERDAPLRPRPAGARPPAGHSAALIGLVGAPHPGPLPEGEREGRAGGGMIPSGGPEQGVEGERASRRRRSDPGPGPEKGPVEDDARGEVGAYHGIVDGWLLLVCAALGVWAVYAFFAYWGGLPAWRADGSAAMTAVRLVLAVAGLNLVLLVADVLYN